MSVGEIVAAVGLAQSTVSQHLRILAEVRFVLADPVGTARHYRINSRCVDCFPSAAGVVLGWVAPSTGGSASARSASADGSAATPPTTARAATCGSSKAAAPPSPDLHLLTRFEGVQTPS
jgi:hypothetical protein